jgi:Amt family ammonium transporter
LIPGHSAPQTAIGAIAIFIGLLAQIAGCSILRDFSPAAAAGNGLLAAAAGGVAALLLGRFRYRIADFHFIVSGLLSGVIASSAAAGRFSPPAAVLVGAVAGLLTPLATVWLDLRRKIDDPGTSISIHLVGGAWGVVAAGLFATEYHDIPRQLGVQLVGLGAISIMSLVICGVGFLAVKATLGLRPNEADELDGIDLVEHDLNAYPDFQQTMIKSYHLRET